MFQNLKNFIGKITGQATRPVPATATAAPTSASVLRPPAMNSVTPASPTAALDRAQVRALVEASRAALADSIALPLTALLGNLPEGVRSRVSSAANAGLTIHLPLKKVTDQLSRGAVKISFGEIKRAAPPELLAATNVADATLIDVPLSAILAQLPAAHWNRRSDQKKIAVPADVLPVFGPDGRTIAPPPARITKRAETLTPHGTVLTPPLQKSGLPKPVSLASAKPAAPLARTSEPIKFPVSARTDTPVPIVHLTTETAPRKATSPTPALPSERATEGTLNVKLQDLAATWPAIVRQEITQHHYFHVLVELPRAEIEQALRHGKITFPWKQIRSWIKQLPPTAISSAHDQEMLTLPLNFIVPIFLGQEKLARPQKSVAIGENIPDLFRTATPASVALPLSEPGSNSTDAALALKLVSLTPTAPVAAATATPTALAAKNFAELFGHGQPGKRHWTPKEIVQKTGTLAGVAGAIITLPEGLLVAGQLPNDFNPETWAAFLPQMFGRLTQYARDLNLGEPSQFTVVVNRRPLQIFKTARIYFGVLGSVDQSLPLPQLELVAAELAKQAK